MIKTDWGNGRATTHDFIKRVHSLLPLLEIPVKLDGVIHHLLGEESLSETVLAEGVFFCPSADRFLEAAEASGVPVRFIEVMDFIYPGSHLERRRVFIPDELIWSLMFPEEFRKRFSGLVYVCNKWESRRAVDPHTIREPYLIEWGELTKFVDWHEEMYGNVFDGDVIFVFEESDTVSVFHQHGGGFIHLYPGESPFAMEDSLYDWLSSGRKRVTEPDAPATGTGSV